MPEMLETNIKEFVFKFWHLVMAVSVMTATPLSSTPFSNILDLKGLRSRRHLLCRALGGI